MSHHRARRRSLGSGRVALALGLLALISCEPKPKAGPPPAPAEAPRPPTTAPVQQAAPQAPQPGFAVGAPQSFHFGSGFVDLADGTQFTRADFERARLRTKDPRARGAVVDAALLIVLDDQTPRPLLADDVPLASLVDEDRELAPGWHVLAVVLASDQKVEVEVLRFQVELQEPLAEHEPGCALLAPGGTTHASSHVVLELVGLPLSEQVASFEYFVKAPSSPRQRVPGLESARLSGLTSGDHRLGVRCYDTDGKLLGESLRTVTLNLDEGTESP